MGLRRGFKTEAVDLVREVRGEIGLSQLDGLDPRRLADHLEISVALLSDLDESDPGVRHLLFVEQDAFSALTVFRRHRRMIVHNDSHAPVRQNSNLAHELAHALLLHNPAPALDGLTGCRNWRDANEAEADWLAGELLVPRDMALAVARGRFTEDDARQRLGVSDRMLQWRLNASGARAQVTRERARRNGHKR